MSKLEPLPHIAAMPSYALANLAPGQLSLAQNESAYPPSPEAIKAAKQALEESALYPDPDWTELRSSIAKVHHIAPPQILCGAGSMELINSLLRAYVGVGDEVLGSAYGYLYVASVCQQACADYVKVPEPAMSVSVVELLSRVTDKTRIVFVCNPGNPTGTRILNSELINLRDQLPNSVLLVVDQAYAEFDPQDQQELFSLVSRGNTVILRTLSKAYALAGQRIGWGIFPERIAEQVRKLLNPNNVTIVAQAMAVAAMQDQAYMQRCVAKTVEVRDRFSNKLLSKGIATPASYTNFVLIPLADTKQASLANSTLQNAGFSLRRMQGYQLGHCLRATITDETVMDAVADILGGLQ